MLHAANDTHAQVARGANQAYTRKPAPSLDEAGSISCLFLPEKYSRQRPTLPCTYAHSTIGGSRLNFRVRNGNGWDPAPMTTGKLAGSRCPAWLPISIAWGPTGWSVAISRAASACRSSQGMSKNSPAGPKPAATYTAYPTTEYPANGSSLSHKLAVLHGAFP